MRSSVHNDFHQGYGIYALFEGLEINDLKKHLAVRSRHETDGLTPAKEQSNGISTTA